MEAEQGRVGGVSQRLEKRMLDCGHDVQLFNYENGRTEKGRDKIVVEQDNLAMGFPLEILHTERAGAEEEDVVGDPELGFGKDTFMYPLFT